jgi:hypothetical protein
MGQHLVINGSPRPARNAARLVNGPEQIADTPAPFWRHVRDAVAERHP